MPHPLGGRGSLVKSRATASKHSEDQPPEIYMNQPVHHDASSSFQDGARNLELGPATSPISRQGNKWRDLALKELNKAQPFSVRKSGVDRLTANLRAFSSDDLVIICEAADDLFAEGVVPEVRELGFTLLMTCANHAGLGLEDRSKFFQWIVVSIEPVGMDRQLQALVAITKHGRKLEPFATPLAGYLAATMEPLYKATVEARKKAKGSHQDVKAQIPERRGLYILFDLITNILNTNPRAIRGKELNSIIRVTLEILRVTPSPREMRGALSIITAAIPASGIPQGYLEQCIHLLCAISEGVEGLQDMARSTLSDLLCSKQQEETLVLLKDTIFSQVHGPESRPAKGAITMFVYLTRNDEGDKTPKISFSQLEAILLRVRNGVANGTRNCLRLIAQLLDSPELVSYLFQSDRWLRLMAALGHIVNDNTDAAAQNRELLYHPSAVLFFTPYETNIPDTSGVSQTTKEDLKDVTTAIGLLWPRLDIIQREAVAGLYYYLRHILSAESERLLVSYILETRMVHPQSGDKWKRHLSQLLSKFILEAQADDEIRCTILQELTSMVSYLKSGQQEMLYFRTAVISMLDGIKIGKEHDLNVINALANFIVTYAQAVDVCDFKYLLDVLLRMLYDTNSDKSLISPFNSFQDGVIANTISIELVRLFMRCSTVSAEKTALIFPALVEVATSRGLPSCMRLPALRLLTRMRCDIHHAIYTTPDADSLGLAAAVARTEATTARLSIYNSQGYRSSLNDEPASIRTGRASTASYSRPTGSRASTQSASRNEADSRVHPPQWMYPGLPGLPEEPPKGPSQLVYLFTRGENENTTLRLGDWLTEVIGMLQGDSEDWEIYSYVLVHLPSQLSNPTLFSGAVPVIKMLRNVIAEQLLNKSFREPPPNTGVKKGDVAFCLFSSLVMLLGYAEHFSRGEQDDTVRIILDGISFWDRCAKVCIQGLSICCHEMPMAVNKSLSAILQKLSQMITQSHLTMDILEFLAGLARLPIVYHNLIEHELRMIFAVCVRYLENARDQQTKRQNGSTTETFQLSNRMSGASGDSGSASDSSNVIDIMRDLPQYFYALAYHVLTIWFLSLRLIDRPSHVGWITKNLASKDSHGNDILEEQSQVALDMMHRTAYSNLGETMAPGNDFPSSEGRILKKSWLLGLSIVTVETAAGTGFTRLVKRQASGTTHSIYQQQTALLPPHHVDAATDPMRPAHESVSDDNFFPNHVFLQLISTIAPTPSPMEPICLPDDEATRRAIAAFDRNDTVDGYKVGVIYVGHNQSEEAQILANTKGSDAFDRLLEGLGTKVGLKNAIFNTQGLDKQLDADGTHTYAWRDRITEIVFHVPTMMPTDLDTDPICINKKRHIGNDFVNIIFNDSGLPFKFDTFPSQFNYVNIVITPEVSFPSPERLSSGENNQQLTDSSATRTSPSSSPSTKHSYFTIQTQSHPSFPQISPTASPKLLTLQHLPGLARQIALHASVFSNVWANRDGGEHVSSWRNRLREIKKLRARFANSATSASDRYPGAKGSKTYVEGDTFSGSVVMGGLAEDEGILAGLDFSRWAGPNPPS
ncbi:Tuberous sclerosis 2-like protein [Lambiella insularis]|nr:Tuberous sclerosis 2-like protein [Lambiella insularis]